MNEDFSRTDLGERAEREPAGDELPRNEIIVIIIIKLWISKMERLHPHI